MIQGLTLAEKYYTTWGTAAIEQVLADFSDVQIAAGLVGEGSQCLGFDDEISQDHDFAPGFCIWLSDADYKKAGQALADAYNSLPASFLGFSRANVIANDRLGVMTVRGFYSRFTGCSENSDYCFKNPDFSCVPASNMDWFLIPEHALAAATNGKVFRDDSGIFTTIREKLLAFYPADILRKKIAARASVMAQAGQYNLLRVIKRGDPVATLLCAARFTEAALSMIYLLNRKYMPFYKWAHRGAADLSLLSEDASLLSELPDLLRGLNQKADYRKAFSITEKICDDTACELRRQGFSASGSSFLEDHLIDIMDGICDPAFRNLPPTADCLN